MEDMLKQLRIVERNSLFVVQIRKQKFFTRRWWWEDMHDHLYDKYSRLPGICEPPISRTIFSTQKKAESYCENFIAPKDTTSGDKVIKTYNTGLSDSYWGRSAAMPKCNPPKTK